MIPVMIAIGVATALIAFGSRKTETKTSGRAIAADPRTYHLRLLRQTIRDGFEPSAWLVDQAIGEAYELGHWQTVAKLESAFPVPSSEPEPPPDTVIQESPGEKVSIVIGKNSPLKGVSNDDWDDFVKKLRSHDASFSSDKHLGAYHHSRHRLSQLGIDPSTLSDEESQYKALERDISDAFEKQSKLIQDYCGDVIDIDGSQHPVTASGILGLVKAAGPKAESWLKNPTERKQFPNTTKMFLETNGVF